MYFELKLTSQSTLDMKQWKKLEHKLDAQAQEAFEKLQKQQESHQLPEQK